MEEPISSVIILLAGLGTINGFVFGVYLFFTKVGRKNANILLGIFLILLSVRFFRSIHFHLYGPERTLFLIGHIAFLIAIPFIYLYFRASLRDNFQLRTWDILLLSPLIVLFSGSFIHMNIVAFSFLIVFTLLSNYELVQFSRKKQQTKTSLRSFHFHWYRNLLIILYLNGIGYLFNLLFNFLPYIIGAISYSFVFYLMIFYWNRHQQRTKQRKIVEKYTSSGLSETEAERCKEELFQKLEEEKLYTDSALNLKKLAELLSIPYYQLSQIINQKLGKNFADFINEYRIAEAKNLLADPEYSKESVENIGYESGFNNPSSFYAAFKKFNQTTPSKYRKEIFAS